MPGISDVIAALKGTSSPDALPFGVGGPAEPAVEAPAFLGPLAKTAYEAAKLPGDVAQGNVPMWGENGHTSPELINRTGDLASMMTLGAGAMPAEANSLNMGIRASHGSPHSFDRFDMSKIGSGQGMQVYGHGLYFAENPKVSNSYANMFDVPVVGEAPFDAKDPMHLAARAIYQAKGSPQLAEHMTNQAVKEYHRRVGMGINPGSLEQLNDLRSTQQALASGGHIPPYRMRDGYRYDVDIDADPTKLIDWNKPVVGQPSEKILQNYLPLHPRMNGEDAILSLESTMGPQNTSALLNKEGIPGSTHWDSNSREGRGDGTRNIVAFNDQIVKILKKYGIAGVPAAGAAASTLNNQPDGSQ